MERFHIFRGVSKGMIGAALLSIGFLANGCSEAAEPATTRDEFCQRWATAACSAEVVSVCQSPSVEDCKYRQRRECLDDLPDDFVDRGVDSCIEAVKNAYKDADLTAKELEIVERLGSPCNRVVLSNDEGQSCEEDTDCEPGLRCILKDEEEGSCGVPTIIDPGFSCSGSNEICTKGFFCDGRNCIAALSEGDSCDNHLQCGEDAFCDGVCFDKFSLGDECESDANCASGICYDVDGDKSCIDRLRLSPAEPRCDSFK